jgi:hypothetical protein
MGGGSGHGFRVSRYAASGKTRRDGCFRKPSPESVRGDAYARTVTPLDAQDTGYNNARFTEPNSRSRSVSTARFVRAVALENRFIVREGR